MLLACRRAAPSESDIFFRGRSKYLLTPLRRPLGQDAPMTEVDLGSRYLLADIADGALNITLARPKRKNAMTVEMYHGVKKACAIAERAPNVQAIRLRGQGDAFCVGGEMGGQHEDSGLDTFTDGIDLTPFVQLERCSKLVICEINGMCQGGGLVMTLMGDLSIASDKATFRVPELLRGIADCYLGARLTARIGIARAKDLLFTAREFGAQEAWDMGLIGRVVPHDSLQAATDEMIQQLRRTAPKARTSLKRDLNRSLPALDTEMFTDSLRADEVREGFQAFVQKRDPNWI